MASQEINRRRVGARYEDMAVDYLKKNQYRILDRNYHDHRYGELDIVAGKGNMIVFLEIKYRNTDTYGDPLEAVDYRKQKKISRTALHYLTTHGYGTEVPCRFDVIAIYGDGRIRHIENAFEYC